MSNPSIVIVPGAWHLPSAYLPLTDALKSAGYTVHPVRLPSVGAEPAHSTFDQDVAAIRSVVEEDVEHGQDVVILMHSYGGIPGGEAAKGLIKEERASQGKSGGVVRLFYMTAFVPDVGVSLFDFLPGHTILPWMSKEGEHTRANDTATTFYNDLSPEVAASLDESLLLQSTGAWRSKATWAAWKKIPSTFLICEKDNAILLPAQEMMSSQEGGLWTVDRCDASHSAFLSMTDKVVESVRKAAGESRS